MTRSAVGIESALWPRRRVEWWLGLVAVLTVSIVYMLHFIDRGWIPHDEGTLAHSAERVLAGELPHRDYVEGYTGFLSYMNAFAFKIFGVHLLAIRYALFVAFIAWVCVFYQAAARITTTITAGAVTLMAVFWSVPNYPAALPSWYNLFLATGGLAALLLYIDSGKRGWLVAAGFAGGLSVIIKSMGLMFVAAGLLFIVYHETQVPPNAADDRRSGAAFQLALGALLITAVIALVAVGLSRRSPVDVYQFALPGLAMVAMIGRSVFREGGPSQKAARLFVRATIPYVLGMAIPVGAFVAYYAAAQALPDLARGLFVLPARAMDGASLNPPVPIGLIPMALAAFVVIDFKGASARMVILQHALAIAVVALALVPKTALALEPFVWASLAGATPVAIPLLAILTARSAGRDVDRVTRSRSVLVGCVAAFCSLVQYPWAAAIYFAYSLPLLLLAVVVVVQGTTYVRRRAIPGFIAFYLVFGALYISPMKLPGLLGPVAREDIAVLDLPRGGLRIGVEDARNYPLAVQLLRSHASSGAIYAGPDAPEVYFLSELRNPTPAMFDYLVPDTLFHQHLLPRLDTIGVNVVALRRRVIHSPPLRPEIQDAFANKFPIASEVGRFTIRWR